MRFKNSGVILVWSTSKEGKSFVAIAQSHSDGTTQKAPFLASIFEIINCPFFIVDWFFVPISFPITVSRILTHFPYSFIVTLLYLFSSWIFVVSLLRINMSQILMRGYLSEYDLLEELELDTQISSISRKCTN